MPSMIDLPEAVRRLPGDDPSVLADLVGDAHVVAIGENNHGVREFGALRAQLVRVLVRELGFGVVALESGFAEGARVDAWIRGSSDDLEDLARDGFTFRAGDPAEMQSLIAGLREHHEAGGRVRFAGLDIPGSGGSPDPALRLVREHLARHAPDAARHHPHPRGRARRLRRAVLPALPGAVGVRQGASLTRRIPGPERQQLYGRILVRETVGQGES